MSMKVKTGKPINVKPQEKIGRRECRLGTFDLPYLTVSYNQKLLFYKGNDFDRMVKKIKHGLEKVLVGFYPLAGKLGQDEEGVFRVEHDDDIDGVEVVEAVAEEVAVEDLAAEEGTGIFKDFIRHNNFSNLEGLRRPLLAVQLTKLKDGLAMGLAFNLAVLDDKSTWHFMSQWAQTCRGSPFTPVSSFLDRTKLRNTGVKLHLPAPPDPNSVSKGVAPPPLRERVFRFSESAISKIKSTVNAKPPPDGSQPFTTFQSLSVHIWRHVTLARELKAKDHTVFTVFVDCRKRVEPPMPESYFGNLIQAISTNTNTTASLLTSREPAFGASLIQKAIVAHNAKAIEERNKQWKQSPKMFQFKDAGVNCVLVGSSPRFKVYDVDFGWGKPEGVRSGSNNRFDGMVYLYQGKGGEKSIDVEIALKASVMEKLEKDKEFSMIG